MGIRTGFLSLLIVLGLGVTGTAPQPAAAKDGENARAAIAALIGAGAAIAAAKHGQNHNANTTWQPSYGQPFEPSRGVTCVPRLRQCFQYGRVNYGWTSRVFG